MNVIIFAAPTTKLTKQLKTWMNINKTRLSGKHCSSIDHKFIIWHLLNMNSPVILESIGRFFEHEHSV